MKKLFAVALIALALAGCTNPKDAHRALDSAGFTDIKTGGYDAFSCSEDDFYATKFEARNPQGKVVRGTVCSGVLFKNATIRF